MHGDDESAMQSVRGAVTDRPWGLTLGGLGAGARSVQLTLCADDEKVYRLTFERGLVVAATSPLPADAVARVALTSHLITPAQVAEVKRRLAAAPGADEVEVAAAAARLTPEQARVLRQKLLLQRAARTFSVDRGTYEVEERVPAVAPAVPGIDVGMVIFTGVRMNLSQQRLSCDLRQLGTRFALAPGARGDLARFGFTAAEQPVLDALAGGTSLPELEASDRELDPRVAQAVIYALASCGALVPLEPLAAGAGPAAGAGRGRSAASAEPAVGRSAASAEPAIPRSATALGSPLPPRVPSLPLPMPRSGAPRASSPRMRGGPPARVAAGSGPLTPPSVDAPSAPAAPGARASRLELPLPAPRARTEDDLPGAVAAGAPAPIDPHAQPTARAAVPRSMIDSFRTGKTTTVRPNALAAHEVAALIEERTALLDRGCDHFTLLGLPVGAPIEDVHGAYVELSRHLRPKRLAELGLADEGFAAQRLLAQIGIAFTVLTDRIRRPEYIASLQSARRQAAGR